MTEEQRLEAQSYKNLGYAYMIQLSCTDPRLKDIDSTISYKENLKIFTGKDMQNAYIDGAKLGEESAWIWIIDYLKNNYDLPEDFVKNMAKASGRTFTTEIMKTWTK